MLRPLRGRRDRGPRALRRAHTPASEVTATVDVAQLLPSRLRVSSGSEYATIQGSRVVGASASTVTITMDGFPADVVINDDVVTLTITPIGLDTSASRGHLGSGSPP